MHQKIHGIRGCMDEAKVNTSGSFAVETNAELDLLLDKLVDASDSVMMRC